MEGQRWGSNVLIKLFFSHSNFFTIASSSPLCSSPLLSLRGRSLQESVLIRSLKGSGDNRPAVDICKCVLALLGSWALGVSRCSDWQKHAQKGVNRKQIKMLQRSRGWHHSLFSSSFLKALVMFGLLQQSGGRRLLNKKKKLPLSAGWVCDFQHRVILPLLSVTSLSVFFFPFLFYSPWDSGQIFSASVSKFLTRDCRGGGGGGTIFIPLANLWFLWFPLGITESFCNRV